MKANPMKCIVVVVSTLLLVSALQAQPRFGVSEADYELAVRWLRTDCLAPDAKPLRDLLLSRRDAMQQAFLGALDQGPTDEEVAAVRTAAAARWRAQKEFIDRPELRQTLPADQWEALRNQTEDDFVRSAVDNFINGYKSNAMSGLAIVGDDDALRRLRELAQQGDSPEAVAARAALAYRETLSER
jgi:hypothetical protein